MQVVVTRWRNLHMLKFSFIPSTSTSTSSFHLASFHSTPPSSQKWKSKWNSDVRSGQQPSKNYIRYATRQKRADAKKALRDLLFKNGSSLFSFQDELPRGKTDKTSSWDASEAGHWHSSDSKGRSKSSARCASNSHQRKIKRKFRQESFFEDFDEYPETIFRATFGNRWYTWSFKSWNESTFQSSTTGFEWRDPSDWTSSKNKAWESASETESEEESSGVGSSSDRTILGLPLRGPIEIDDVKNAFRLSALKWHPDKHQGPSQQAMAEEKFKVCVDAYKSLCIALSSA